jgi:hypothetical protein
MAVKSRIYMVSGIFVLSLLSAYCFGAAEPRNPQTPDPKVTEAAIKIQQSLDIILTEVNKGSKPTASHLAGSQRLLEEFRRYFSQMDDKAKAQYCLLQSWSAYYADEIEVAHLNAAKACKLDATDGDAWASQVAMALLADKRPMMPRTAKSARTQRNRANGGESPEAAQTAASIQKGKLDFDLSLFLAEAVGKQIEPLQLHCLNGTTLDYQPGSESLCLLFWRKFTQAIPATVMTDPNGKAIPQAAVPEMMIRNEGMNSTGNFGQPSEETFYGVFGKLFQAGIGGGRMKFLAVNLDTTTHRKQPQPWAQVIIADQAESIFPDFRSMPMSNDSVLLITDTTGTIRYAGPATGFIAPMLCEEITGNTTPLSGKTKNTIESVLSPLVSMDSNSLAAIDSNSLLIDSNSLPADSNSLLRAIQAPAVQQPAVQAEQPRPQNQYKELSEEDKIQAEKLINYTEDLFMKAAGRHVGTYKRGVELCRQVMKDYPGSEYADRARQLLRQVPENQRTRYGITDQELGL